MVKAKPRSGLKILAWAKTSFEIKSMIISFSSNIVLAIDVSILFKNTLRIKALVVAGTIPWHRNFSSSTTKTTSHNFWALHNRTKFFQLLVQCCWLIESQFRQWAHASLRQVIFPNVPDWKRSRSASGWHYDVTVERWVINVAYSDNCEKILQFAINIYI